jgi:solute carrier family 1 (high affinity glutamate transporter) protein 1
MAKMLPTNKLLLAILIGIVAGIVLGGASPEAGRQVKFLGELFLQVLLMLVVPLVMASMVVGITGLGDIRKLGSIGGRTIAYYMVTTALSVIIGILLVNIVKPGLAETPEAQLAMRGGEQHEDARYQIDGNRVILVDARFERRADERYIVELGDQGIQGEFSGDQEPGTEREVVTWTRQGEPVSPEAQGVGIRVDLTIAGTVKGKQDKSIGDVLKDVLLGLIPTNLFEAMANNRILPLIIFAMVFGAVLTTIGEKGRPVIAVFEGVNEAMMEIIRLLMILAPVGIGALIAGRLGDAGGFRGFLPELENLGWYAATVIGGLLFHALVVLPLILKVVGKRSVLPYAGNVASALTTAFSTASSSATLPLTMRCTTVRNQVSDRTASFVLPLGATINMDGTALYEAVAAIFIAQMYGIELTTAHMVVIFLAATLAAIGAAGIPEAGLVTMVIVLQAVNLPIEGISLILVIDWFLDRCRTTVNVWGDSVGAAVVEQSGTNVMMGENEIRKL